MTLQYYPFYWGDYTTKTFHLSLEEHGAYFLLMRYIYTTGNPVPNKQCYSIAKALLEQHTAAVDSVLDQFFVLEGDSWRNLTCEEVMEEAFESHDKRKKAGKTGGKARAEAMLKQCSRNAQATKPKPKPTFKKETPLPPKPVDNSAGRVFKNLEGGKGSFRIDHYLKDDDRAAARKNAPGWDLHQLMIIYDEGRAERGIPTHPAKAFIAWCAKYTKGKSPN